MSSPDYKRVIAAFARDPRVSVGEGKGFGSGGLKVDGKLFSMMSSRGQFVAKLPKQRVSELIAQGRGEAFDPGHGRLMREWVEMHGGEGEWVKLAREARRFVGGDA